MITIKHNDETDLWEGERACDLCDYPAAALAHELDDIHRGLNTITVGWALGQRVPVVKEHGGGEAVCDICPSCIRELEANGGEAIRKPRLAVHQKEEQADV